MIRAFAIACLAFGLAACQADGYMGRACEDKGLKAGSADYQACIDAESRRAAIEANRYRNGR